MAELLKTKEEELTTADLASYGIPPKLLFDKRGDGSAAVDGRKKCLGIEFAAFLGSRCGCHDWPPFKNSECAEGNFP